VTRSDSRENQVQAAIELRLKSFNIHAAQRH